MLGVYDGKGFLGTLLRGGKTSFISKEKLKYITIKPGGVFSKELNLSQIIKEIGSGVFPGLYKTYHNQYGDNCIQGCFDAEEVAAEI